MTFIAHLNNYIIRYSAIGSFIFGITIFIIPIPYHYDIYTYIISACFLASIINIILFFGSYLFIRYAPERLFQIIRNMDDTPNDFMEKTVKKMNTAEYYLNDTSLLLIVNIFIGYNMTGFILAGFNTTVFILYIMNITTVKLFAEMFNYKMQNK